MAKYQIVSGLLNQGFVRGTKEFKNAYQKELRKKNPGKEREKQKKHREKKEKSNPGWNSERVKKWRDLNPVKQKRISDRATKKGCHERFYKKNRERILGEKISYGKKKRRENPLFGIRKCIAECKRGNIKPDELISRISRALAKLKQESN